MKPSDIDFDFWFWQEAIINPPVNCKKTMTPQAGLIVMKEKINWHLQLTWRIAQQACKGISEVHEEKSGVQKQSNSEKIT